MSRLNPMRPLFAALLIGIGVVGCGDSSTEPGDELKPSEAEALYDALVGMISFAISDPSNPVIAERVTRSCSRGGEVTVSTEVEFGTDGVGRVSWGIAPDACGVSSRGWEFKLDGNPDVLIAVAIRFSEDFTESVMDGSMMTNRRPSVPPPERCAVWTLNSTDSREPRNADHRVQ